MSPLNIHALRLSPHALGNQQRGAVILPEMHIEQSNPGVSIKGSDFDPFVIRTALLFFDRIDYPANNIIQIGPETPPGLEDWGGWQRTRTEFTGAKGNQLLDVFRRSLVSTFEALDERESGRWTIARSAASNLIPQSALSPNIAFSLKLHNALPIPDQTVPYDEVLLFKDRRQAELTSLRHHMETIGLEVARHGYGGLAETIAFESFQKALADHISVSKETNFLKRLTSIEMKFHWDELLNPISMLGVAGTAASVFYNLPLIQAIWPALTAAGPLISIESTLGIKRRNISNSPFEYIIQATREL